MLGGFRPSRREGKGEIMANNSDIHRDPETTSKSLTGKARQHSVRVSKNVTD